MEIICFLWDLKQFLLRIFRTKSSNTLSSQTFSVFFLFEDVPKSIKILHSMVTLTRLVCLASCWECVVRGVQLPNPSNSSKTVNWILRFGSVGGGIIQNKLEPKQKEGCPKNVKKLSWILYFVFTLSPICLLKALCTQYFPTFVEKKKHTPQANHSGGIRTHNLCIARADDLPLDHRASPAARGSSNSMC